MTTPIVFLDTETTSLRPDRRAWDIGIIRREPDGIEREITLFVSDIDLSGADLIALRIGHFYERHPMYRAEIGGAFVAETEDDDTVDFNQAQQLLDTDECLYPERRVAQIVERWTRGAHIVGSVPNFDTECLAAMLRRHGLCPAWHYHLIDVEPLAIGWLRGLMSADGYADKSFCTDIDTEPPWKSDDISRACGVEPPGDDERHTAMGDAKWVARLFDRITGGKPE
jgi:hypothetical protein